MKITRQKLRQLIYEALDQDKYQKLKSLIYSDDIELVIMGMNILSTFLDDSTGSNIDQQLYGLYNEIGNLYNDKRTELQSEIRELKVLLNFYRKKENKYVQMIEDYQRELGLQSRSDFMKTSYDMLTPHQKKYYDLWNEVRRDYKYNFEIISDVELQIEEKESQLAEFIQVYNNVFDSGAFRMSSDDGTSSVYIQDPVMESKKYTNKKMY